MITQRSINGSSRKRRNTPGIKTKGAAARLRKKRRLAKQTELEKEAPLSRYTEIPTECGETILAEVRKFLETRITDKWLYLEKEKLKQKHAESSKDSIDSLLLSSLGKDAKFKGKDLKELISKQRNLLLVDSTRVSRYTCIGIQNINTYVTRGVGGSMIGSINCILSDQANLTNDVVCRWSIRDVPIFIIPGLTKVLREFTELEEDNSSIAFKKVKDSPFNELLNVIAQNIPDETVTEVVYVKTIDGLKQMSWKESIAHSHQDFIEDGTNSEEESDPGVKSKKNFTGGLPRISIEDRKMILTKLDAVLKDTFPRFLVGCRRALLKENNPTLDAGEIDKHLYVWMLCNEFCSGSDIIDVLPSCSDKSSGEYVVPTSAEMYKHINNKLQPGSFHFMLFCNSAKAYVNSNRGFTFRKVIPQLEVRGLSSIIGKYFGFNTNDEGERTVLAFKKVDDTPYKDFIKFVENKLSECASILQNVGEDTKDTKVQQSPYYRDT